MASSMAWSRRFAAPPPPTSTSSLPVCASARSVTSVSMAKAFSCSEKQTSSFGCTAAASLAADIMPENDRSMPLTT